MDDLTDDKLNPVDCCKKLWEWTKYETPLIVLAAFMVVTFLDLPACLLAVPVATFKLYQMLVHGAGQFDNTRIFQQVEEMKTAQYVLIAFGGVLSAVLAVRFIMIGYEEVVQHHVHTMHSWAMDFILGTGGGISMHQVGHGIGHHVTEMATKHSQDGWYGVKDHIHEHVSKAWENMNEIRDLPQQ